MVRISEISDIEGGESAASIDGSELSVRSALLNPSS
jgi:hypothetical protein